MVRRQRVAASVRLILAMFHLYADIQAGFGKAVLNILKEQFPDQDIDISAPTIGHKLMAIARRQLQGNDQDSMDAIQNLLTYLATGPIYERDESGKTVKDPETGESILLQSPKPWDFSKDSDTWQQALDKIYSNLRTNAMGGSMGKSRRINKERSIDDTFGRRTDNGESEGAADRMPTETENSLGQALDDQAAIREFFNVIDDHIGDLKTFLSDDSKKLFDLIFEDEIGDFGSDVKENMGQATALKEQYPELFEKHSKRWSGYVGDLRKKLLQEILDYIETEMSNKDYARLREQFFGDVDPSAVRKLERKKRDEKTSYQRMLDENKVSRLKSKLQNGDLSSKDQKDLDRLTDRLKGQGVDVDNIPADSFAGAKRKDKEESRAATIAVAAAIISAKIRSVAWMI